ncbi:hypothetical protein [Streptomyces sp. NBC_00690]|nr:hypothetical protein [Streptomyces sp. NBC_00690]
MSSWDPGIAPITGALLDAGEDAPEQTHSYRPTRTDRPVQTHSYATP